MQGGSNSNDQDWTDDLKFYIDQKGPRLQRMEGVDGKLSKKQKAAAVQCVQQSSTNSVLTEKEISISTNESGNEEEEDNETDDDY